MEAPFHARLPCNDTRFEEYSVSSSCSTTKGKKEKKRRGATVGAGTTKKEEKSTEYSGFQDILAGIFMKFAGGQTGALGGSRIEDGEKKLGHEVRVFTLIRNRASRNERRINISARSSTNITDYFYRSLSILVHSDSSF